MTLDHITQLINKHGTITAQPLLDLVVTVVLEAVEATERESRAEVERLRTEILRLRVAMARAAQRADDWPDSNDDPAECLANCASILFDALDYRHVAALAGGNERQGEASIGGGRSDE